MRSLRGFSLLEVLVALAIAGIAIGTLFGLLGGSKRLGWGSSEALARSVYLRAAINAAQVQPRPEYPVRPDRREWAAKAEPGRMLERPERQTRPTRFALESYRVLDDQGRQLAEAVRWKQLEVAK